MRAAVRVPAAGPATAPPLVYQVLGTAGGRLDPAARSYLEPRFNYDFSAVRVHDDADADAASAAVGARAFTVGHHIAFAAGAYAPHTEDGRRLIAHELAHALQQGGGVRGDGPAVPTGLAVLAVGETDDPLERAADAMAGQVMRTPAGAAGLVPAAGGARAQVQRQDAAAGPANVADLDQQYRDAVLAGDWTTAAERLNSFNFEDIQVRLARLSPEQVADLHRGAIDNRRVGPQSQVAQLSDPDRPRASFLPPAASVTPPPSAGPASRAAAGPAPSPAAHGPAGDQAVARMPGLDRLAEAYGRASIAQGVRDKIASMFTPQALVAAIISTAAVFAIAQFTPVGWAADLALLGTALFVGGAVIGALRHLVNFARARDASTDAELTQAGQEFAAAMGELIVDAILLILTHGLGQGGPSPEGAPTREVALALTEDGTVVAVAAETIPATIPVQQAAELGLKAGAASTSLMAAASGGGGGPAGPGPGLGGTPARSPAGPRAAEQQYLDRLKQRFPRLAQLDIRPRLRPSAGSYLAPAEETPEVGGSPQYRPQASGAPEFAFEERMRTSQGNFSLVIVDRGVVMELDGISGEGWLENVKIEQRLASVDEILARLRVEADFAEAYGLRGVHYSIGPAAVGDAVEAQVAQERLANVFRVE
jgi:Domain of unknown function (DUF4157)